MVEAQMIDLVHNSMKKVVAEARPEFFVQEEVMDTLGACAFLKCSRATLHRLIKNGVINPHRPGNKPLFLKSELIEEVKRT